MQRRTFIASSAASALLVMFRNQAFAKDPDWMKNPLLAPFTGPYGGVPPWDKIKTANIKPALLAGMELHRAELAAIVASKEAPTFANTIAAFEDAGRPLGRAVGLMSTLTGTMNDKAMQAIETETAPLLAAYSDEVIQNEALFARIKAVWDGRAAAKLEPDQARLLEIHYRAFARRGAALGKKDKQRTKEINEKLAALYTTFRQNVLADEETNIVVLEKEADLAGLPDALKAAAADNAEAKNLKGKWVIRNTRSSVDPFLTYSTQRDLRKKVWQMFVGRGDTGKTDNKPTMTQILALRSERAKLFGHPSHAHWIVDDNMAKKPETAMALMLKVWPAAIARVREEVADMQKLADGEKANLKVEPWDYRFYAEKVRKAKYDLDQNEVKGYLQLENMREAMFWAAGQLYGLKFTQVRERVPVYQPDVRVYEVTRAAKRVGLWYFDPYARDGKRSGAWMSEYRTQETFKQNLTPIVSNNSNYVKGKPGETVLISWDDAETLFHEFGHALHGLLSNIRYPTLAGTNTLRDFVEFPSQINEHWLSTPEVLNKFAIHYKTKKPISPELVGKIQKAKNFNQGFTTVEYLMSAIYDMRIHMAPGGKPIDPGAFETSVFKEIGAPKEIVMRHRPTQFLHIFADDGYSAGYYSYLWADTLTADAAEAFKEAGSLYDKATAKRFHDTILSIGNSVPPDEAFRKFRGRDVDTNALMRDRGFPVGK